MQVPLWGAVCLSRPRALSPGLAAAPARDLEISPVQR
jgi:hypothetical protein